MKIAELADNIVHQPVDALRPHPANARTHSKKQIRQVADSIRAFGFRNPIQVDESGQMLAGHARWEAAKSLGLRSVSTIVLSGLTEPEKRAYMIADNKLAQNAGWDREILASEVGELSVLLPEIELDVSITGFDGGEVDALLTDMGAETPEPEDRLPMVASRAVS